MSFLPHGYDVVRDVRDCCNRVTSGLYALRYTYWGLQMIIFGAYDGVIFSPKSVTPRIRRYFQHDHFIPIVGVGKRGEY